jgi:putative endonuclease
MSHRKPERTKDPTRQAHERAGRIAEAVAALCLMLRGYRIVDRRYRCRSGEIDVIAARGRRLAFVEVKKRPSLAAAEAAITGVTARRLRRAAEIWISRNPAFGHHEVGLDAMLVASGVMPRYIPNALQMV